MCFIYSTLSFGQSKYAIILGGGEIESGPGTLFDKTIPLLGKYFSSNPRIVYDYAFGSGHVETQNLLNSNLGNAEIKRLFNSSNAEDILKKYIGKIERSEIVSGDQIAVFILAHGRPKTKDEKTHAIYALTENKSEFYSLDVLEKLQKLANENGINLLISDNSCYSGNTQNLGNEKTCVVSNTDASIFGHFDSNSFVFNFLKRLREGKNVEELFFESRKASTDNGFPRVSANYDRKTYESYFKELRPFLLSVSKYIYLDNGGLLNYLNTISSAEGQKNNKDSFTRLLKALDTIQDGLREDKYQASFLGTKNLSELKNHLFKIQNFFNDYIKFKLSVKKAKEVITIKYMTTDGVKKIEKQTAVYYGDLIWGDFHTYLNHADKNNPTDMAEVERIRGVLNFREDLYYTDRQFNFQLKAFKKLESRARLLRDNLDIIAREEKILYDYLHTKFRSDAEKISNPCRDFVF